MVQAVKPPRSDLQMRMMAFVGFFILDFAVIFSFMIIAGASGGFSVGNIGKYLLPIVPISAIVGPFLLLYRITKIAIFISTIPLIILWVLFPLMELVELAKKIVM